MWWNRVGRIILAYMQSPDLLPGNEAKESGVGGFGGVPN